MKRIGTVLLLIGVAVAGGCGSVGRAQPAADADTPDQAQPGVASAASTILPRPFTAEEIREAWVAGFSLKVRRKTPDGEIFERWTVVAADADGAEIEYVTLDPEGNPAREPRVVRSEWTELRDHASFPAATSRRERVKRKTPLGALDGWLYTVRDEDEGIVTEFFFVKGFPGAPVHMRVKRGGEVVAEFAQLERHQPE